MLYGPTWSMELRYELTSSSGQKHAKSVILESRGLNFGFLFQFSRGSKTPVLTHKVGRTESFQLSDLYITAAGINQTPMQERRAFNTTSLGASKMFPPGLLPIELLGKPQSVPPLIPLGYHKRLAGFIARPRQQDFILAIARFLPGDASKLDAIAIHIFSSRSTLWRRKWKNVHKKEK